MSTTIDSKVVEMRFDNKHFETNVSKSMSTLDKLKAKLNLTGASKGLEGIGQTARKVDFNPLCNSVEQVGIKFNAMYTIADQALRNITNSAVNTGKQLLKNLTVDQLTAGWSKYDEKTASVQTIMNSTGKSIDEVNGYLSKLMWFSDETSYGFTDMTAALAQMTSSGGDINKLIPLITGVANATAYAGKGASEFSRVMYNLNQSYGAGYLQMMDWRSVELAGVGSQQLKQAFIDAAVDMGKINEGDVTLANFSTTLKDKWADTEVMEAAFSKFAEFSEQVEKLVNGDLEGFSDEIKELYNKGEIETASDAIEALSGHYGELGETAFKSAQEAKTFQEAIDATKDAVSSGWMKSFELIFGNFQQAKVLWTDLANALWDIFAAGSEFRNSVLESALGRTFTETMDKVRKAIDAVTEPIQEVTAALVDYDKLVDEIIAGKWGNAPTRWQDLAAAGYDWAHAQNLVNERLGSSVRHATNYTESTQKATTATTELTDSQKDLIKQYLAMSDAELKQLGLTDEQIAAFHDLRKIIDKLGMSVDDFLANVDDMDGRWILMDSFKNIGSSIMKILEAIKGALRDIFGLTGSEEENIAKASNKLFDFMAAFHRLSEKLKMSDETAEKLRATFRGLFAALDLIRLIVAGPIKLAFTLISKVLSSLGLGTLDVTAYVGDLIYKFRNWVKENEVFTIIFDKLVNIIKNAVLAFWELDAVQWVFGNMKTAFANVKDFVSNGFTEWITKIDELVEGMRNGSISISSALSSLGGMIKRTLLKIPLVKTIYKWVKAFAELPEVQNTIKKLKTTLENFKNTVSGRFTKAFDRIREVFAQSKDLGKNLIEGLQHGMKNGTLKIKDAIIQLGKFVINTFKNILGIHSPSTVFFALGGFIIAGLLGGLKNGLGGITSLFSGLGGNITGILTKIPWGSVLTAGFGVGILSFGHKLADGFKQLTSPLQGFGNMLTSFGEVAENSTKGINKVLTGTSKVLKGVKNYINAKAFQTIAISIAILVGGLALLTLVDPKKLLVAGAAILAVAGMMVGLVVLLNKFGPKGLEQVKDFGSLTTSVLKLTGAILAISSALKILTGLNSDNMGTALMGLTVALIGVAGLMLAYKLCMSKVAANDKVEKPGETFKGMAEGISKLALLVGTLGLLSPTVVAKGLVALLGIVGVMSVMMLITKLFQGVGNDKQSVGDTVAKMADGMSKLALLISTLGLLPEKVILKGELALLGMVGIMSLIMLITKLFNGVGNDKQSVGDTVAKMAEALAVLAGTISVLGMIPTENLIKGEAALVGLVGIMALMMYITKTFGKYAANVGKTMMQLAGSIAILAGVAILLGFIPTENLAKGMIAVSAMVGMMSLLMSSLKSVNINTQAVVVIIASIALLAAAITGLSFIDPKRLASSTAALGIVMTTFGLMVKMLSTADGDKIKIKPMLIMLGVVGVLAGVVAMLAKFDPNGVIKNATGLSLLLIAMAASMKILGTVKSVNNKVITSMLYLGVVVLEMGIILGLLNKFDMHASLNDVITLSAMIAAMAGVLVILGKVKKVNNSSITSLLYLGVVVAEMGVILGLLNKFDMHASLSDVLVLSLMLYSMAGVLAVLKAIKKVNNSSITSLLYLGVVVAEMGVILGLLNKFDMHASLSDVLVLSTMLYAMAGVLAVLKKIKKVNNSSITSLLYLGLVVAELGAILGIMSKFDAHASMADVVALSAMLAAMVGVLAILKKIKKVNNSVIGSMALLGLVVAELAVILALMSVCNTENAIPNATALSILLGVMSGVLAVLSVLGPLTSAALPGVGALALLGLVALELAAVLAIMSALDCDESIQNALALSALILALSLALVPLTLVGSAAPAAIAGVGLLALFIVAIGGLLIAIGAIADKWKNAETFLDKGMKILDKIGYAIGSFFGNIIAGFTTSVLQVIPALGECLSDFMENASPFIEGCKNVDETTKNGILILTEAILLLCAAEFIKGITDIITLGGSFGSLGKQLSDFGKAVVPFVDSMSKVDLTVVDGAKALSEVIINISKANLMNAISFWIGAGDLNTFGVQLKSFGRAIVKFSGIVAGNIDATAVEAAANAGNMMAKLANSLPNNGGIVSWFTGDNRLSGFGRHMKEFGEGVVAFSDTVKGKIDPTAVEAAANAGNIMVQLAKTIPNSGGIVTWFTGDNKLSNFGKQMKTFGEGVAGFSAAVKGKIDETSVQAAANAGNIMVQLAGTIPNSGGVFSWFTGDNDLATFGEQIKKFGAGIKGFSDSIVDIDPEAVTKTATATGSLVELSNALPKTGGLQQFFSGKENIANFGRKLVSFGNSIVSFSGIIAEADTDALTNASEGLKVITTMAKDLSGLDFDGFKTFGKSLGSFGKSGVESFINAFSDSVEDIKAAGKGLVTNIISGAESASDDLEDSLSTIASDAADEVSSKSIISDFTSAGKDLIDGLIKGLKNKIKKQELYNAAFALGELAVKGEKEGQKSNSPSKATEQAGIWLGEGLIIGIDEMGRSVYKSGRGLGETAARSISSAVARISEMVDTNIDSQPTIRPVLDLTDVTNGVGALGGLFGDQSVGVMANVNSISSMMNNNQNGINDDVVSAINKLRNDLGNVGGTTYSIAGVNVSSDAEVTSAIETLVRAARTERRI